MVVGMGMALDYSTGPKRDGVATAFCVMAWALWPAGVFAWMYTGSWHSGIYSPPHWAHPRVCDLLATGEAVGFPLAGSVAALVAARSRQWSLRLWALGALAMQLYCLWVFGRMEVWFWSN